MPGAARARSSAWLLAAGPALAVAAVVVLGSAPPALVVLLVLAGIGAVAVRLAGVGLAVGVLVLAGVNALPGLDLQATRLVAWARFQDLAVVALLGACVVAGRAGPALVGRERDRLRTAVVWSGCFLALWTLTVVRSAVCERVPLTHGLVFGRDFAYFALLVPAALWGLRAPGVRRVAVVTMGAGLAFVAVGQVVAVAAGYVPTWWIHTLLDRRYNGLTRLETPSSDLVLVGLPIAIGLGLWGRTRLVRRAAGAVALLSLLALLVELNRARYIGAVLGLGFAAAVWLVGASAAATVARRRAFGAVALLACLVAVLVAVAPSSSGSVLGGVTTRAASTFGDIASSSPDSTVGVRRLELAALRQRVDGDWLLGLGLLDPRDRYDPGLYFGTIRNSDLGVLNVAATMGVVGAVVYYAPLVWVMLLLVRRRFARPGPPADWGVGFGALAALGMVVASSPTLVTLFTPTGVVVVAAVLALGLTTLEVEASTSSDLPT